MRRLGNYELFETIGAGAMSAVYRAVEDGTGRVVAVKILHPHLKSTTNVARFEREVHVLKTLKHPNIVELFDFSNAGGGEVYSVLEYIDGQELSDFLSKEREITPDLTAMIVIELARALAVAHVQGIIHRDLKPENILVRKDGTLKISDFGLAYLWEGTDLTMPGTLIGSPAYMSPEQIRGEKPAPRMDVFSLGIVFYLMLTGELPFKGKSRRETFDQILSQTPPEPKELQSQISAPLSDLCMSMLGKKNFERVGAADDVIRSLEGYLSSVGLSDFEPVLKQYLSNPKQNREAVRKELLNAYLKMGARAMDEKESGRALELFRRVLVLTGVAARPRSESEESRPTQKVTPPKRSISNRWRLAVIVVAALLALWVWFMTAL